MAGSQSSFRWDAGKINTGLSGFEPRLTRALVAAIEFQATRGETYMRKNARWSDRSTNARNGLFTATFHEGSSHVITFYHTVPYGIWLEIAMSGKYRIIMPSVDFAGVATMKMLNKLTERL